MGKKKIPMAFSRMDIHIINHSLCGVKDVIILIYDEQILRWQITCIFMYLHWDEPNKKSAGTSAGQESVSNAVDTSPAMPDSILPQLQSYV